MLGLEATIVERLRTTLAAAGVKAKVMSAADLAGMKDAFQFAPAVHVIYQGYRVKETRANNLVSLVEQTWLTVAAVRNVRDQKTGAAARNDSKDINAAVYQAMAGWLPPGAWEPFRLADGPGAGFEGCVFFIPLAWKTLIQLSRDVDDDFPVLKHVTNDYTGGDVQEIYDDDVPVPGDDGDGAAPEDG